MVFVKVTGAEELMKFLEEISSPKKMDQVTRTIAERTAKLAFILCPEDTGKMENDIRVEKNANGEYEVICDVPYAVHNEFGTYCMPCGTEENPLAITSTSGKGAYRPFLRPAHYATMADLPQIINAIYFGRVVALSQGEM